MVGIKLATGVQLSTGEKVDAYYLDQEGYDRLLKAGDINGRFESIWKPVREALQNSFRLQEILVKQLADLCKVRMFEWLQKNMKPTKSFKDSDIRQQFAKDGYGRTASRLAFEALVTEGKIVRRGKSYWYRLKEA